MKLDIGVCSYRNPERLKATLESIEKQTSSDWRCFIIHNPAPDDNDAREVILQASQRNKRFVPCWLEENVGYAGAVNELMRVATSEYFAYCDNDVEIMTPGWDGQFAQLLGENPEVGQVFPGAGHYGFHNGRYHECLWNAGYCWMIRRSALDKMAEVDAQHRTVGEVDYGKIDRNLGHHEEVDLMIRLRLAGFQTGCRPDVQVVHHQSATNSPESAKRIHAGVVRWMNKWNRYFCGDVLKYPNPDPDSGEGYDPRCLRYTDWSPCALYLERMTLAKFPDWNGAPRSVMVEGVGEMDAIEILKPKGCYASRAI